MWFHPLLCQGLVWNLFTLFNKCNSVGVTQHCSVWAFIVPDGFMVIRIWYQPVEGRNHPTAKWIRRLQSSICWWNVGSFFIFTDLKNVEDLNKKWNKYSCQRNQGNVRYSNLLFHNKTTLCLGPTGQLVLLKSKLIQRLKRSVNWSDQ